MIEKPNDLPHYTGCDCDWCAIHPEPEKGEATCPSDAMSCSAWFLCADKMPKLGQIVWLYDASVNTVWLGSREDDADGWLWGNAYGSVWHNGEKWDADVETDDDYTPTHWMPLPSLPNS